MCRADDLGASQRDCLDPIPDDQAKVPEGLDAPAAHVYRDFVPVLFDQVPDGWVVRILHREGGYVHAAYFDTERDAADLANNISRALMSWQITPDPKPVLRPTTPPVRMRRD